MFSAYLIFVSFTISLLQMKNSLDISGLIAGSVSLIAAILFEIGLIKASRYFGEFKSGFLKTTPNCYFYNFLIIERMLVGVLLALITWLSFQGFLLGVFYLL